LAERLHLSGQLHLERNHERLSAQQSALKALRPDRFNKLLRQQVKGQEARLAPALKAVVVRRKEQLGDRLHLLNELSPLGVMQRGYAAISTPKGQPVQQVAQVAAGDTLHLRLKDGEVRATATEVAAKALSGAAKPPKS